MKKLVIKKLVTLFTLVCVMSTVLVLPLQASTLTPVTPTPKVVHTSLTNIIHPMDPVVYWTETYNMRTYTSTYFQDLSTATIEGSLLYLLHVPAGPSFFLGTAGAFQMFWHASSGSHTGFELVQYFWTPSNIVGAPYYVKKHINYYTDLQYSNYLTSTDEYYYSQSPY